MAIGIYKHIIIQSSKEVYKYKHFINNILIFNNNRLNQLFMNLLKHFFDQITLVSINERLKISLYLYIKAY
jgi:hypothetical protein